MGCRAARMHDAFRNAFMIEMGDLLAEMKSSSNDGPRSPAFSEF